MPVGPDQQDVRLRELDLVPAARLLLDLDALVVVVDRDRQLLLGLLLPDHVLVEELLDLLGNRQRRSGSAPRLEPVVVRDDVVADLDALIADEDRRARNQLADVVLILVAEGAAKDLAVAGFLDHMGFVPWELSAFGYQLSSQRMSGQRSTATSSHQKAAR